MQCIDLFSGIGGWALAARRMGWETLAFVEKDKFCQKVLTKNFPGVPIYDDVITFSAKPFLGRVGILTGSTPCQPFSQAGKREGSSDERHLFPELLRVAAECQPAWICIENVRGLLSIEDGSVFEAYCTSLEGLGYFVTTFCIPACAVAAPHRRDRLWIIANSENYAANLQLSFTDADRGRFQECVQPDGESSAGLQASRRYDFDGCGSIDTDPAESGLPFAGQAEFGEFQTEGRKGLDDRFELDNRDAPDPRNEGLQGNEFEKAFGEGSRASRPTAERTRYANWIEAATRLCNVDDGLPGGLVRPKGWRVNALKAGGNTIHPEIAYQIFKAIEQSESLTPTPATKGSETK